jgi:16S rRNA (guanine966-N2)-methyltransferase
VRISGGQLKGRRVAAQKILLKKDGDYRLRPTSAKVREAVIDILRSGLVGAVFLDLYAGTGSVGFEALSRGAGSAYFIEEDRNRSKIIEDFIKKTGLAGRAYIFKEKVQDFLRRSSRSAMSFDIVFADPPYVSDEIGQMLQLIDASDLLRKGGSLIVEHSSKVIMRNNLESLTCIKHYRYGDTTLTLYRKNDG